MSRFFNPALAGLAPYVPGEQPREQGLIKLNTNENPYPPTPRIQAAVAEEMTRLRLYPDPTGRALHRAIAGHYQLAENNVLAANGSDEILAFAFLAFVDGERGAAFADITYGFYQVWANLFAKPARQIPLRADLTVDVAAFAAAPETLFLANPNAPTGMALPLADIEQIAAANRDRLFVVDEAYVDFGNESAACLIPAYDNLVVVQTYSKSRSLAGGRLGFALAQPSLIEDLNRVKFSFNPYNIDRLTMAAGVAAMVDEGYFGECCQKIIDVREQTRASLRGLGCEVLPSQTNFIFVKAPSLNGEEYYRALRTRGILVRWFNQPRIANYVRVTIGSAEEMAALVTATESILKGASS